MGKKKKKKLNIRRLIVFILIIYIIISSSLKIVNEPIHNIIITGNNLVSDKDIIELSNIKDYPPILFLNIKEMKNSILTNPLINDVEIKRDLRFRLKINVQELKVICLNKSTNMLLLSDGSSTNNTSKYLGVPILINYTPEEILKKLLNGLKDIDEGTLSNISEIEYSPSTDSNNNIVDDTRFLLKMNDGNLVYINISKINTLKYYQKIYASLKDNKGILHLDSGDYLEVIK